MATAVLGYRFVTETMLDLCWRSLDGTLHQACAMRRSGKLLHLCVEALPGGGWDWLVWPAEDPAQNRHGTTMTRAEAMGAAGRASAQFGAVGAAAP